MPHPLYIFLSAAVPMQIAQIQARGGLRDSDYAEAFTMAQEIATQGDTLLYGGKRGAAGTLANRVARALAILALQPGGVKFGDEHWESSP